MKSSGEQVANELRAVITKELGITASVGVSWNKVFAKLGSDYKKPNATTVFSRENFKEKIWPLPASDLLYVGRATNRKLANYGIHTIGQLAETNSDFLRRQFGKRGRISVGICDRPRSFTGCTNELHKPDQKHRKFHDDLP